MAAVEDEGVCVKWIGQEIDKILKASDSCRLTQNVDQLRQRIVAPQQQLDEASSELERLKLEMAGQWADIASSSKYIIHFFQ